MNKTFDLASPTPPLSSENRLGSGSSQAFLLHPVSGKTTMSGTLGSRLRFGVFTQQRVERQRTPFVSKMRSQDYAEDRD
jgi:hypothetical protein